MAACQTVAVRTYIAHRPHRTASRRPTHAVQAQLDDAAEAPVEVPAVGWLWDKKANDTKKRLQEQRIRPKKSLGQNFMLDDSVLASIVAAADVRPGDLVLEIGPGTGNLTRHLLGAGALVTAVEKDYTLSDTLGEEFNGVLEMRLVCGDILRQDLSQLLAGMHQHAAEHAAAAAQWAGDGHAQDVQQGPSISGGGTEAAGGTGGGGGTGRVKVVANLPYYITKDCLLQMLPRGGEISDLYFMLQDEVGVRLTQVDPGASDWRAMNLLTQYYARPQYLFKIDRRKYLPPPKVHGAVVRFALTPPAQRLAVPSEPGFLILVRKAFSQRRKVVRNALRPLHEPADVAAALAGMGLNEGARAQDLTLQQFADLAWALARQQEAAAAEEPAEQ